MATAATHTRLTSAAPRTREATKEDHTVLVLGGTGFLGSHVLAKLARHPQLKGKELVVSHLPNEPTEAITAFLKAQNVRHRFVEIDLTKLDAKFTRELGRASHILNLSGRYDAGQGPASEERMRLVNADAARTFFEILLQQKSWYGIDPKVIYISSVAVMGDTKGRVLRGGQSVMGAGRGGSVYERTKRIGQYWAEVADAGGVQVDIIQPGMLFGEPGISGVASDRSPVTRMVRDASLGGIPIRARTGFGVCPTSASDVGDVIVTSLFQEESGRIIGASSNNTRLSFMLDCARALRGLSPLRHLGAIPDGALYFAGQAQRYLPRSANRRLGEYLDYRGLPPELLGAYDATRGTYWRTSNAEEISGVKLPEGSLPVLMMIAGDFHYNGIDTVSIDRALATLMQGGYDLTLGPDGTKDLAVETLQLALH